MLHTVPWSAFIQTVLALTSGYYVVILAMFYRKEIKSILRKKGLPAAIILNLAGMISSRHLLAQADGNNGINQANSMVRSYFDSGANLVYAVGAIVALIGAVRVHSKWNSSHSEAAKEAALWFGGCVFLVVVTTVIKSFFGV